MIYFIKAAMYETNVYMLSEYWSNISCVYQHWLHYHDSPISLAISWVKSDGLWSKLESVLNLPPLKGWTIKYLSWGVISWVGILIYYIATFPIWNEV